MALSRVDQPDPDMWVCDGLLSCVMVRGLWQPPMSTLQQNKAVRNSGSPGKGAKTDQNIWRLPRFKNFQAAAQMF
jgi:hypothetical protein